MNSVLKSDAYYRAVVSALGDSIFVFDLHGRVMSCNAAAQLMIGESEQALAGTSRLMPEGWEPLRADGTAMPEEEMPVRRVLVGAGTKQEALVRFRNSAGTLRWFEMRAQPIVDTDGGRMTAVLLLVAEVTQRQMAEEALRENEALLRLTTEFADVATWEYNVAADLMSRSANHDRLYGLPWQDHWHAATFLTATHMDDRVRANQIIQDALAPNGADTYAFDFRVIRPDGSQCWLWVKGLIAKRDESGAGLLVRGVLIDVTSRKYAEAELMRHRLYLEELVEQRTADLRAARDEAERLEKAKGEFLANMSHEIRTPLNSIIGLNYLMRRDGLSPEQAARMDRIEASSQHLLELINDVLDFAKLDVDKVQLEEADFGLSAVFDQVHAIIAESAQEKGLAIQLELGAAPQWLRGDPTRLRQALLNFAGNAVKFSNSGLIRIAATLLEERDSAVLLKFSVTDSGVGIAAEHLPRLFQMFEQADASMTRRYGGTGLGLAITQRLATLMNGDCGVESELGVGSTFWFTAVLKRGQAVRRDGDLDAVATAEVQLRQRHGQARILLAEDNEVNREVMLAIVQGVGMSVDVATDGRAAVDMARVGAYDVVLMDIQMPVMNGLEATRMIRQLAGWQERPILALTANSYEEDRRVCRAAGMNDFIAKPIRIEAFYASLLKWLEFREGAQHPGLERIA